MSAEDTELEDVGSPEFKAAVKEETARWRHAVKATARWTRDFQSMYDAALPPTRTWAQETIVFTGYTVYIQHTFGHRMNVWICAEDGTEISYMGVSYFDLDASRTHYCVIRDVGDGAEKLELTVYELGKKTSLWKVAPVGPAAVFHTQDVVLYQSVENHLRYPGVIAADKLTGRKAHTIFEERDKRVQVVLTAPPNQPDTFIITQNALMQRIGLVTKSLSVTWMTQVTESTLIPISKDAWLTNMHLVLDGRRHALPAGGFAVDAVCDTTGAIHVTTVIEGATSLYTFRDGTFTPVEVCKTPSEIRLHTYCSGYTLSTPCKPDVVVHGATRTCAPEPLKLSYFKHGFAGSARVPYTIVSAVPRPRALIVEGYGAYGLCARRSYPIKWLPYLKRGYALAIAMPRGGREKGDAWYDGGRTAARKKHTFDDTAAVIAAVQRRLRIAPCNTVFYGRSAGGWLAAAIAQFYTHLVGAVYAEVPYVDVLRTASNPALPLTQLEYDEFGDPAHRPAEFAALRRISPVDTVPEAPVGGGPLVVIKTAINDMQVLPYEALKWAKKLRSRGWKRVYVGIDGAGGHFAAADVMAVQQAEDAALVFPATSASASATRKFRNHCAATVTRRRRRSSLKH